MSSSNDVNATPASVTRKRSAPADFEQQPSHRGPAMWPTPEKELSDLCSPQFAEATSLTSETEAQSQPVTFNLDNTRDFNPTVTSDCEVPTWVGDDLRSDGTERRFHCPGLNGDGQCDRATTTKQSLQIHYKDAHLNAKYECNYPGCGVIMTNRTNCRRHFREHNAVQIQFNCRFCEHVSFRKDNFKRHKKTHGHGRPDTIEDGEETKVKPRGDGHPSPASE